MEAVSDKGNLYKVLVSSFGRVVDMDFISKPLHDNGNGYFTFNVTGCVRYIHRAVAQMFLDGDNSLQVNHKDGNKAHNNVENLEWVTGSSNIKHAHKAGLMKKHTENGNINILSEDQVVFLYTEVKKYGKGISDTALKWAFQGLQLVVLSIKEADQTLQINLILYFKMPRIELDDTQLEAKVAKLLPWSSKRYKTVDEMCSNPCLKMVKYDWMTRLYTKKIVILLQHGFSRREVAYRLGCHRHTVEMVATGRCWHHREPVYIEPHLRPRAGRKPANNRPDKVKDNQLTFTPEQEKC